MNHAAEGIRQPKSCVVEQNDNEIGCGPRLDASVDNFLESWGYEIRWQTPITGTIEGYRRCDLRGDVERQAWKLKSK
jgi:hypothetical protein